MIILKAVLCLVIFGLLPLLLGSIISDVTKMYPEIGFSALCFRYLCGNLMMWSLYQLIAVPMILYQCSFTASVLIWAGILAALVILWSIFRSKRMSNSLWNQIRDDASHITRIRIHPDQLPECTWILIIAAVVLIGLQCGQLLFRMHIDLDDTRFVAEAVNAYQRDTMLTTHPIFGTEYTYWNADRLKDSISPWPLYLAVIARCVQIHPTIIAHSIYPVFLILISYMIVWLIGGIWFSEMLQKAGFLFAAALIQTFFASTHRSVAEFLLVRTWQGKAVVAGICIPLLFLILQWMLLSVRKSALPFGGIIFLSMLTTLSACLMSGMGIIIAGTMAGLSWVYCGLFCIRTRQWKNLLAGILPCIPPLMYGILYFYLMLVV